MKAIIKLDDKEYECEIQESNKSLQNYKNQIIENNRQINVISEALVEIEVKF
jgi:hypothetical protein